MRRRPIKSWIMLAAYLLLTALLLAFNSLLLLFALAQSRLLRQDLLEKVTDVLQIGTGTGHAGPLLAWTAFTAVFLLSLLALLMAWRILALARAARCGNASDELLEATEWLMQNIRENSASKNPYAPIRHQIEQWYEEREKDVIRLANERTAEWTRELQMATDFQLAMIQRPYPKIPEIHIADRIRLNFYHHYHAASGLGGDFFDIIKVDRDVGGIFIADVMGHGTRSALITSMLRTLITDALPHGRNSALFLEQINKNFCDILKTVPDLVFASALYFVADTTARMATFSSAGHMPPIHIRRSVNRVEFAKLPLARAAALGIRPEEEFPGTSIRLIPEDVFIFYTDGLVEAFGPDDEEFGEERMRRVVENNMYRDIKTIVDNLYQAVVQWTGNKPMSDDICMIAVEATARRPEPKGKKHEGKMDPAQNQCAQG